MKILLIGATGGTGQEILPRLLAAGHTVTALVRRPEAITTKHEHLVVMPGGVRPGRLLNEPARGGVKASADGAGIKHSMMRADLA